MDMHLPDNVRSPLPSDSPASKYVGEGDVLLTRAEAAELLRLNRQTLERWAREGSGPKCTLVGRRALYPLAELRRFAGLDSAA